MEDNNRYKRPKSMFWPLFTTAIASALVGVLIACLIIPVVLKGSMPQGETQTTVQGSGDTVINLGGYENPAVAVAQKCMDSVVYVESATVSTIGKYAGQEHITDVGSGVILKSDGYILTNCHVIEDANSIYVTLNDGTKLLAKAIGADASSDLAVIKVEKQGLKAAELGDSSTLKVGELAVAIGNPFGSTVGNSQSVGYISALNRTITTDGASIRYIQTDAAMNPGNSGGGLFNAKGQLIGINSLKSRISGYDQNGNTVYAEGIGFAIPVDDAKMIAEELIQKGKVSRPGIGIVVYSDGAASGVIVDKVVANGPAGAAGIRALDVIIAVDGVGIASSEDYMAALNKKSIGDQMVLTIRRGSNELEISVEVGDMSEIEYE